MAGLDLSSKAAFGGGCGDKALVLDQTTGLVDELPVRHIVEQECELGVGLSHRFMVTQILAGAVLDPVDEAHSQVVEKELHKAPHDRLGDETKKSIGQFLIFAAQGLG